MGEELRLSLTTHAGADEVRLEEALHTYLFVLAWERSGIDGLGGTSYFDKLTGRTEAAPDGELRLHGETDRVFHSTGAVTVRSEPLGRAITVAKANSASTVVWNPGPENAAELDDMGAAESHEFICVETANALGDAVTVPPHTAHTMSCRITCEAASTG
jgi:glucose-6-phosphate 1-epimerase